MRLLCAGFTRVLKQATGDLAELRVDAEICGTQFGFNKTVSRMELIVGDYRRPYPQVWKMRQRLLPKICVLCRHMQRYAGFFRELPKRHPDGSSQEQRVDLRFAAKDASGDGESEPGHLLLSLLEEAIALLGKLQPVQQQLWFVLCSRQVGQ